MTHYSHTRPIYDWLESSVLMELDAARARPYEPPMQRLACVMCDAHRRIPLSGMDMVRAQIAMWRSGWRRDPVSARDYCPDHAAVRRLA